MIQKTLILERRGCDFWKDCHERENSNLENFRLCGKIKNRHREYFLEISTTHTNDKRFIKRNKELGIGKTYTYIDNEFDRVETIKHADGSEYQSKMAYRDLKKLVFCHPTKEAVLIAINKTFGTNYTQIEILPYGETIKDL